MHAHSLFRALIWKDKGYSESTTTTTNTMSTGPFPRSFYLRWSEVEAREPDLKRLQFDVVVKISHEWINALLIKKKRDRSSSYEWGGQP